MTFLLFDLMASVLDLMEFNDLSEITTILQAGNKY